MDSESYIGKLIGNTGQPDRLTVALRDSYSARRGEFVRIAHRERRGEPATDVLERTVALSRSGTTTIASWYFRRAAEVGKVGRRVGNHKRNGDSR